MKLSFASPVFLFLCYLALEVRQTQAQTAQAACTPTGNECVGITNAFCDTTLPKPMCVCNVNHGPSEDNKNCLLDNGQPCTQDAQCLRQLCTTIDGTKKCAIKLGATCTANGNECLSILNSACMPTVLKCNCAGNYTATGDLLQCKLNEGQPCTDNKQCLNNMCSVTDGIMKCSGAPSGISMSVLLIVASFVTSRYL